MDRSISYQQFLEKPPQKACFRFTPTPSGYLHLGNGVNFVLTWLFAKSIPNAEILLRIDDIDKARKRPEYIQDIFDSLDWLGLDYSLGPKDLDDFESNWSQHKRLDLYHAYLKELKEKDYLFPCKKSRKELSAYQQYPAEFRTQNVDFDAPNVAWRLKGNLDKGIDDFVVRKKDGLPSYQVVSLLDDLHFRVTHVVRGSDLKDSTSMQLYLAEVSEKFSFLRTKFWHHPLIRNESGLKLSKSKGAEALLSFRLQNESPSYVYNQALKILGLPANHYKDSADLLSYFLSNNQNKFKLSK